MYTILGNLIYEAIQSGDIFFSYRWTDFDYFESRAGDLIDSLYVFWYLRYFFGIVTVFVRNYSSRSDEVSVVSHFYLSGITKLTDI